MAAERRSENVIETSGESDGHRESMERFDMPKCRAGPLLETRPATRRLSSLIFEYHTGELVSMSDSVLMQQALGLAARGWRVFPNDSEQDGNL